MDQKTKYVERYCKQIVPEKWVLSGNWPGVTVVEGPLDTFVDNKGVIYVPVCVAPGTRLVLSPTSYP